MANNMRPTLPPLSSLNLPTLPLGEMVDRRSSSPESYEAKHSARCAHSEGWHRRRQLSVSSSCTDVSDRSISPELERGFPRRSDVHYLRVRRVEDAHFMLLLFPSTSSSSVSGQSHPPRSTKLIIGAEMQRMLSRAPKFPTGTVGFLYRIIPLVGPNAVPVRRLSTSSTTSQETS